MGIVTQTITLWADEWFFVVGMLTGLVLIYHARKIWIANEGVTLILVLGLSLCAVFALFLFSRSILWEFQISARVALFIALFLWCAAGTIFLAAHHTERIKLLLGIASEAGIIYTLFRFV